MLDNTRISTFKVKFKVYYTRITEYLVNDELVEKRQPIPTHRTIFHQSEGTEHEVTQRGHQLVVHMLQQEDAKNGTETRPVFQYTIEVTQ